MAPPGVDFTWYCYLLCWLSWTCLASSAHSTASRMAYCLCDSRAAISYLVRCVLEKFCCCWFLMSFLECWRRREAAALMVGFGGIMHCLR